MADSLVAIRQRALGIGLDAWPELGGDLQQVLPDPLDGFALLPVITAIAVGGPAARERGTAVAAPIVLQALAFTILDDIVDDDREHSVPRRWGAARAATFAGTLQSVALGAVHGLRIPNLVEAWLAAAVRVHQGQEQDRRVDIGSLRDYRQVVQHKTVDAFAFAALAGAMAADPHSPSLEACQRAGAHLGWMIQLLDDLDAFWGPVGEAELARGLRTFPFWLGVERGVPEVRAWSADPGAAGALDRLRRGLDASGIRSDVLRLAADERDHAIQALAGLDPAASDGLSAWLDWLFRDWQRLAGWTEADAHPAPGTRP